MDRCNNTRAGSGVKPISTAAPSGRVSSNEGQKAHRFSTSPLPLHLLHWCEARPPIPEVLPLPLQAGQRSIRGGFVSQPIFHLLSEARFRKSGSKDYTAGMTGIEPAVSPLIVERFTIKLHAQSGWEDSNLQASRHCRDVHPRHSVLS